MDISVRLTRDVTAGAMAPARCVTSPRGEVQPTASRSRQSVRPVPVVARDLLTQHRRGGGMDNDVNYALQVAISYALERDASIHALAFSGSPNLRDEVVQTAQSLGLGHVQIRIDPGEGPLKLVAVELG